MKTVKELCDQTEKDKEKANFLTYKCPNLKILGPESVYPIHWGYYQAFLNETLWKTFANTMKNSFGLHYWNHLLEKDGDNVEMKREHPLYQLFEKECPFTEKRILRAELMDAETYDFA